MVGERTITITGHEFQVKRHSSTRDQALIGLLRGIYFITNNGGAAFLIQLTSRNKSADVTLDSSKPPRAVVIQKSRGR